MAITRTRTAAVSKSITTTPTITKTKTRATKRAVAVKASKAVSKKEVKVKKEVKIKKEPRVTKEPKVKKEPKTKKEVKVKKEHKAEKVVEPKTKRVKKPKIDAGISPEERLILGPSLYGRIVRAMKQKMFVVSRVFNEDNCTEEFNVLGSVGNAYTVKIAQHISCTCMDYSIRRHHCKHIIMIMLKVYHLPYSHALFQKLNCTKAQREDAIHSYAKVVDPSVLVPADIRERILNIYNGTSASTSTGHAQRRPLDLSDCPICFEEFEEVDLVKIDYCKVCGNNIHTECLNRWLETKHDDPTCVYCRSKWIVPGNITKKRPAQMMDSDHLNESYYANFSQELGISRKRDSAFYNL